MVLNRSVTGDVRQAPNNWRSGCYLVDCIPGPHARYQSGCAQLWGGSEVRFELMPKEAGSFEVGADVLLFETSDCSGPPVPKVVENLMVEVVVNEGKIVEQGLGKLMTIAWDRFLEFWGASVTLLLFAVCCLLFAVRGKFKQWFGFK